MSLAALMITGGLSFMSLAGEPTPDAPTGANAAATTSVRRPAEAEPLPCEGGFPATPKKAPPRPVPPASPTEADVNATRWAALGVGGAIQLVWPVVAGTIGLMAGAAVAQTPPGATMPLALIIGGAGLGCASTGPVLGVAEVLVANHLGSRRQSYVWPVVVGTTGELLAVGAGIGAMIASFMLLPPADMYNLTPLVIAPTAGAIVYTVLGLATVWAVSFTYDVESGPRTAGDDGQKPTDPLARPPAAPGPVAAASPQRQRF